MARIVPKVPTVLNQIIRPPLPVPASDPRQDASWRNQSITRPTDPRGRTNTTPPSPLGLNERSQRMSPRPPDRGGFRPMNGVPQVLPTGKVGGTPNMVRPLLDGLQKAPLFKASQGTANAAMLAQVQEINRRRLENKPFITVKPGLGGLRVAQSPRIRPDYRIGTQLWRSGISDVRNQRGGEFVQHRTAPKIVVDAQVGKGGRSYTVEEFMGKAGKTPIYTPADPGDVERVGVDPPALSNPGDVGRPIVRVSAQERETFTVGGFGIGEGFERFAFLAGVVLIGFLALRRG